MYKPKVKVGHVVPGVPLHRVKERLALVRGSIVEAPIVRYSAAAVQPTPLWAPVLTIRYVSQEFLIDEKEFVEGPEWSRLNPTLPIYI